jgi:WD40 repeat protein
LEYNELIVSVAFNPDGRTFITGGGDTKVRIYDPDTAREILQIPHLHSLSVLSAAFSPDGKHLLTGRAVRRSDGYFGGTADLWDVATGRSLGLSLPTRQPILGVAFSPRGDTFLIAQGSEAQLWTTGTKSPSGSPYVHGNWIRPVAFSPDGRTILTGSFDKSARLWDVATTRPIGPPLLHRDWVSCGAFSPDGRTVATGSKDCTVRISEFPAPLAASLEHIGLWVEVITGLRLNDMGTVETLEPEELERRRLQLKSIGGPPRFGWTSEPLER